MMPVMIGRKRRPPLTVILVAVMLILLPLLAYLQYDSQGKVSERLREQMQETMRRMAAQFGEDFDREITRVFGSFQPAVLTSSKPAERDRQLRQDYAALYTRWNQTALYPKLVSEIYLNSRLNDATQQLERLNPLSGEFERVEWPADLLPLRSPSKVSMLRLGANVEQFIQLPTGAVDRRIPAVIIPVIDSEPTSPPGFHFDLRIPAPVAKAIIKLNLDYIQKEF